jgi:lipopolysaccharide transport system permease protein
MNIHFVSGNGVNYGMLGLGLECYFGNGYQIQDLNILVEFGVRLLMYVSAVYVSRFVFCGKTAKYAWWWNTIRCHLSIESVRYMLLNTGVLMSSISYVIIHYNRFVFLGIIFSGQKEFFI